MTVAATLMSSASSTWQTPDCVLDLVRQMGPIALDPCTTPDNPTGAKAICVAPKDWSPRVGGLVPVGADGLNQDWPALANGGLIYVNPPYGRDITAWALRCETAARYGAEVIALLPARTDTSWWHHFVAPPMSDAICFWRGRLTFKGAPAGAPFPSAIAYYGARRDLFADVFSARGSIWT